VAPELVWTFQRRDKSLFDAGIQIPYYPSHSLVTTLTVLLSKNMLSFSIFA
jgi:hypothetical protein